MCMRTMVDWFTARAEVTWRAFPGRSFLLVVPHGCDMAGATTSVRMWVEKGIVLPLASRRLTAAVTALTADSVTSSRHFVRRLAHSISRVVPGANDVADEEYSADYLEAVVDNTLALGSHPVVLIERFHAFARIADGDLLSVLATMRTLEHAGRLTTINLSSRSYSSIRRQLQAEGHYPFVNSAYGDNHEKAELRPLTRPEFLVSAAAAGIPEPRAQRIYGLGGGPDLIYQALIQAAVENVELS